MVARVASEVPSDSLVVSTRSAWRRWLSANFSRDHGLWIITRKRSAGGRVSYDDLVEEALCFGWIDSKPRTLDSESSMLWFSPRRNGSAWSGKNKERVRRLIADRRMHPAGLAKIAEAKRDGCWTRLDGATQLRVPKDLRLAFNSNPDALKNFRGFPPSAQRAILEWIATARSEETRARRVTEAASKAAKNERANQWRKRTSI